MSDHPSSWNEYLSNKVALEGAFNGRGPVLGSMVLAHMVLDRCNELYVSLTLPALPEGSSARWLAKSYDQLQLRLSFFDLAQLSIAGGAYEGNLDVLAVVSSIRIRRDATASHTRSFMH